MSSGTGFNLSLEVNMKMTFRQLFLMNDATGPLFISPQFTVRQPFITSNCSCTQLHLMQTIFTDEGRVFSRKIKMCLSQEMITKNLLRKFLFNQRLVGKSGMASTCTQNIAPLSGFKCFYYP